MTTKTIEYRVKFDDKDLFRDVIYHLIRWVLLTVVTLGMALIVYPFYLVRFIADRISIKTSYEVDSQPYSAEPYVKPPTPTEKFLNDELRRQKRLHAAWHGWGRRNNPSPVNQPENLRDNLQEQTNHPPLEKKSHVPAAPFMYGCSHSPTRKNSHTGGRGQYRPVNQARPEIPSHNRLTATLTRK